MIQQTVTGRKGGAAHKFKTYCKKKGVGNNGGQ